MRHTSAPTRRTPRWSVFLDLFEGVPQGKFPLLDDRDDLWSLLAVITARKVTDLRRRQGRAKRDGGHIVGESDLEGDEIGRVADAGPAPDLAVMMAEEFRLRIEALDDDQIRQVALLRLDGYSNEEIAARMGCATRTVIRRINAIRETWRRDAG